MSITLFLICFFRSSLFHFIRHVVFKWFRDSRGLAAIRTELIHDLTMREVTFFTGGQLGLEVGRKVRDLEVQQTCSRCTGANENFKDLCYTEVLRVALTVSQEIVLHTTATVIICISVLYQHMHLLNPPTHVWVMVRWSKKKKIKGSPWTRSIFVPEPQGSLNLQAKKKCVHTQEPEWYIAHAMIWKV